MFQRLFKLLFVVDLLQTSVACMNIFVQYDCLYKACLYLRGCVDSVRLLFCILTYLTFSAFVNFLFSFVVLCIFADGIIP
jgi:hypothetical protein